MVPVFLTSVTEWDVVAIDKRGDIENDVLRDLCFILGSLLC